MPDIPPQVAEKGRAKREEKERLYEIVHLLVEKEKPKLLSFLPFINRMDNKNTNDLFISSQKFSFTLSDLIAQGIDFGQRKPVYKLIKQLFETVKVFGSHGIILSNISPETIYLMQKDGKEIENKGEPDEQFTYLKDLLNNEELIPVFANLEQAKVIPRGQKFYQKKPKDNLVSETEYSAPEMKADSVFIDERVDIFSIGCIMFELLTGLKFKQIDNYFVNEEGKLFIEGGNVEISCYNDLNISEEALEILVYCLAPQDKRPNLNDILKQSFFDADDFDVANEPDRDGNLVLLKESFLEENSSAFLDSCHFNGIIPTKNEENKLEDGVDDSNKIELSSGKEEKSKDAESKINKENQELIEKLKIINGLTDEEAAVQAYFLLLEEEYNAFKNPCNLAMDQMTKESYSNFEDWEIGF